MIADTMDGGNVLFIYFNYFTTSKLRLLLRRKESLGVKVNAKTLVDGTGYTILNRRQKIKLYSCSKKWRAENWVKCEPIYSYLKRIKHNKKN